MILGIYLFVYDVVNFVTYLCIVFSMGMLLVRFFRVIVAERGGFNERKRESVSFVPVAMVGKVEGLIEMMEMENEGEVTIAENFPSSHSECIKDEMPLN